MKKVLCSWFVYLCMWPLLAQPTAVETLVQQSVAAYNQQDINTFMALFADTIAMYDFAVCSHRVKGKKAVRALYQDFFEASPNLRTTILKRIVFDNKVIDHEYIEGAKGNKTPYELIFIYEIENNKIIRTTAIRPQ